MTTPTIRRAPNMAQDPDRNLALELVRATEAAAINCSRYLGFGDKNQVDAAAVDGGDSRHGVEDIDEVAERGEMDVLAARGVPAVAVARRPVEPFDTQVPIPDWQLTPEEEVFGDATLDANAGAGDASRDDASRDNGARQAIAGALDADHGGERCALA